MYAILTMIWQLQRKICILHWLPSLSLLSQHMCSWDNTHCPHCNLQYIHNNRNSLHCTYTCNTAMKVFYEPGKSTLATCTCTSWTRVIVCHAGTWWIVCELDIYLLPSPHTLNSTRSCHAGTCKHSSLCCQQCGSHSKVTVGSMGTWLGIAWRCNQLLYLLLHCRELGSYLLRESGVEGRGPGWQG